MMIPALNPAPRFDPHQCDHSAHRVTRQGDAGHIEPASEGAVSLNIQAPEFMQDELQVSPPRRQGQKEGLIVGP